jgi:demethylmenaquinone methyltransferase/2-methoxy-6-polyprenyl-1,4-benzoquinol methylase
VRESELLSEQRRYYRARAPEYDAWWQRQGRYNRGAAANAQWFAEVAVLERALEQFGPGGDILELACGTGLWTNVLVRHARRLTAVDAAPEMIARARARLGDARAQLVEADLFAWSPPPGAYDLCFFGFWLSHVPESRFDPFWMTVADALRPAGRVFFIDSDRSERSTAFDHHLPPADEETMLRRLDSGHEFRIVKRFYSPPWLERRLAGLGFRVAVRRTGEFFIYGAGECVRSAAGRHGRSAAKAARRR